MLSTLSWSISKTFTLTSILEREVPHRDLFLLAVAVEATDALFETVRVPRQFVVDHDVAAVLLRSIPSLAASVAKSNRDWP